MWVSDERPDGISYFGRATRHRLLCDGGLVMKGSRALSDTQLQLVDRVARSLPAGQRENFLQAVAARLAGTPADHAVEEAVNVALDRAQPMLMCDPKGGSNGQTR